MIFTHYGSNCFDKDRFNEIENINFFIKPRGGLWAADEQTKYLWKHFLSEEIGKNTDLFFQFKLKKESRILKIENVEDLKDVAKIKDKIFILNIVLLDFEKISKSYDAIYVKLSDNDVFMALHGWDFDSILVLNSNIIVPI